MLVLAGTTEATDLARALVTDGIEVISSLAGVTATPVARPGRVRTGGFGDVDGLRDFLLRERIDALIDATHPFAAQMPHHAAAAATAANVPIVRLLRPPWMPRDGDQWIDVADLASAAEALGPIGATTVLLTVGRRSLGPFRACTGMQFVVRSIDAPDDLPPGATLVCARGPFTFEDELRLLQEHEIDVVVAKNAGGDATRAKLDAARELELPVVMVRRPPQPAIPQVSDVDSARCWLNGLH